MPAFLALAATIWLHAVSARPWRVGDYQWPAAVRMLLAMRPAGDLPDRFTTAWWQGFGLAHEEALSLKDPAATDLRDEEGRWGEWRKASANRYRQTGVGAVAVWSLRQEVLVRFFSDGVLAAGTPQRLPFGLGDANGVLTTGGPDQLDVTILDSTGAEVTTVTAPRHGEGLPRPYWPVNLELTTAGLYTAQIDVGGSTASAALTITPVEQVAIPKVGDELLAVLSNGELLAAPQAKLEWRRIMPQIAGVAAVTTMADA